MDAEIAFYQKAFSWWRECDAITVAAVQGHAVGAGFQLALGCDLRVVADDVAFAMKETSLGLVPDLAGTWPLVEAVGYARALEICVSGRSVGRGRGRRDRSGRRRPYRPTGSARPSTRWSRPCSRRRPLR